jgi:putative DNA primase/helicase
MTDVGSAPMTGDWFDDLEPAPVWGDLPDTPPPDEAKPAEDAEDAQQWIGPPAIATVPAVTRFEIRDAAGELVAIHCRLGDGPGKKLWWELPDGRRGLGGLPLADLPLFGIERLDGRATVVTEGEKAAQALQDAGMPAVGTVTGAAATPGRAALADLTGRSIVLWPDADDVGGKHMKRIADGLAGIVADVRRIDWPDAPEHGDAADYLAAGGDPLVLIAVAETVRTAERAAECPTEPSEAPAHLVKQSRAAWHFAEMAGDRVRYDHGRGRWLIWSCHRWQPDEDGSVERPWLAILGDRYRLALAADDRERQRQLAEVQTAGATNSAVTSGLELASSMVPIATRADAWDPDPMVLGCDNGVVDLRTGELRPGRPEDMISRSTLIAYNPDAECPRWQRFLREVFAGDDELIDWFGLLVGSSLVGRSKELLAVHRGRGANGKSVAIRTLRRALGEYAVAIAVETLVNAKRSAGEATPDLMVLRGARLAFATEPDKAAKLRGGTLKRLVSIDQMTGRGLYGSPASWEPTHSLHLATNHLPAADDATDGFWRRIALVPWAVRFGKPGEDGLPEEPNLAETLAGEAAGILAWAVRGAVAYASGRSLWPFPAAVRVKTEAYRAEEDKLGAFVAARVVYEKDAQVTLGALYAAYEAWCQQEDVPLVERFKSRAFCAYFEERGRVERFIDSARRTAFLGARLASHADSQTHDPIRGVSTRAIDIEEVRESSSEPANLRDEPAAPLDIDWFSAPLATASFERDTIACSDYEAHQLQHRRDGSGWRCLVCSGAA